MGPAHTRVLVPARTAVHCVRFHLAHAVRKGIPWPSPGGVPRRVLNAVRAREALPPALAFALLEVSDGSTLPLQEILSQRHPDDATDLLIRRLQGTLEARGVSGAYLVRMVVDDGQRPGTPSWLPPSMDLELTMAVLTRCGPPLFLARKSPLLVRLLPQTALDVVGFPAGGDA